MTLIKRGSTYHAKFKTAHGVKSVSTKETTRGGAEKMVAAAGLKELEHMARSGAVTADAIGKIVTGKKLTIAKALPHYANWLASVGKSPKTVDNNVRTVETWARDMKLESAPPSSIGEDSINQWINKIANSKASTRFINLSALRSFFGFCAAKGWSVGDPARLVRVSLKGLTHMQKETTERGVFDPYEIKRLVKYLTDTGETFWLFAVRLSLETGLRLGDICQLEWDCLSENNMITVWTDKRDKRVSVPISESVTDLLVKIPVTHPRFIFPEQREIVNDLKRRALLSVKFSRLLAKCEITGKSFHCARHTCITRWSKEGKTLESIAELVGHSKTSTTAGYVHP